MRLATSLSLGDAVLPFAKIDKETWLSTRCKNRQALGCDLNLHRTAKSKAFISSLLM